MFTIILGLFLATTSAPPSAAYAQVHLCATERMALDMAATLYLHRARRIPDAKLVAPQGCIALTTLEKRGTLRGFWSQSTETPRAWPYPHDTEHPSFVVRMHRIARIASTNRNDMRYRWYVYVVKIPGVEI